MPGNTNWPSLKLLIEKVITNHIDTAKRELVEKKDCSFICDSNDIWPNSHSMLSNISVYSHLSKSRSVKYGAGTVWWVMPFGMLYHYRISTTKWDLRRWQFVGEVSGWLPASSQFQD